MPTHLRSRPRTFRLHSVNQQNLSVQMYSKNGESFLQLQYMRQEGSKQFNNDWNIQEKANGSRTLKYTKHS